MNYGVVGSCCNWKGMVVGSCLMVDDSCLKAGGNCWVVNCSCWIVDRDSGSE